MQMRKVKRLGASAVAVLMLSMWAGHAHAQASMLLDPSARSGGMGGASAAVGWGGTNTWADPALMAVTPGFTAEVSDQRLLYPWRDSHFDVSRFTMALAGLAWTSAGRPLGSQVLSGFVSEHQSTDGIGISAAGLADVIAVAAGRRNRLSAWGDVAWGRQWKQVGVSTPFGGSFFSTQDDGWYVRLAPFDSRRGSPTPVGGTRFELGYAHVTLDDDGSLYHVPGNISFQADTPLPRITRDGGAVHMLWYGPNRGAEPGAALTDAFRGGIGPLVELTVAYDHERVRSIFAPDLPSPTGLVSHYGLEANWIRVLSTRFGYVDDKTGGVQKPAWGFGIVLPGRNNEFRYDFASAPQPAQHRVYRHEITVRVDPLTRWFGLQSANETR
jgi:hypothetical protein